jgi:hypothetical protein
MANLEKDQLQSAVPEFTHGSSSDHFNMDQPLAENTTSFKDDFTNFYKGDFKKILTIFFKNPIDGLREVFEKTSNKAYKNALILFISVFLLYSLGFYLMAGKARRYMEFSDFLKFGLIPVVFMLFISVMSFSMKSTLGKAQLKDELFTGALCGIPLGILFLILFSLQLFGKDTMLDLIRDPEDIGAFASLVSVFIFLMFINIVQQSVKSARGSDSLAWYGSPLAVLLSFYLTYQVVIEMIY